MKLFNINNDTMVRRSYAVATSILLFGSLSVDALIDGTFTVETGDHYASPKSCWLWFCSGPNWGSSSESKWFTKVTFPDAAADYGPGSSCFDNNSVEYYDWNKSVGKARCNGNHQNDSDRFVWRRLQDIHGAPNCGDDTPDCRGIQIATYSYDGGTKPFPNENWELSRTFSHILQPKIPYILGMESFSDGRVVHTLHDDNWTLLETQTNQHSNLCPSNYEVGNVLGLYFGGTCTAPQDVTVTYEAVEEPEITTSTSTLATTTSITTSEASTTSTTLPQTTSSTTSSQASTTIASTSSQASSTVASTSSQASTTVATTSEASSTSTVASTSEASTTSSVSLPYVLSVKSVHMMCTFRVR